MAVFSRRKLIRGDPHIALLAEPDCEMQAGEG